FPGQTKALAIGLQPVLTSKKIVGGWSMRRFRTPDSHFERLPDWPFSPNYAEVGEQLRLHYVDEGDAAAQPVLMLHGEPTWGFLYRHMIRPTKDAGFRVLVPDLIGFGRSDKPLARSAHS